MEEKKNVRKVNRQHGLPYKTAAGKHIPGKLLSTKVCNDKCKEKCNENFNYDLRLSIFNKYWKINTLEEKRQYIFSLVKSGSKSKCPIPILVENLAENIFLKTLLGKMSKYVKSFFLVHSA